MKPLSTCLQLLQPAETIDLLSDQIRQTQNIWSKFCVFEDFDHQVFHGNQTIEETPAIFDEAESLVPPNGEILI